MDYAQDVLLEFLTPEALALFDSIDDGETNPEASFHLESGPPAQPILSEENSQILPCKRHSSDDEGIFQGSQSHPPSVFQKDPPLRAKRTKFDPIRRAEVAELRKKGVCFRCKVSKAKGGCSIELPCRSCVRSQAATTGRKSLHQWMLCVAYNFGGVDVFAIQFPCCEEKYISILQSSDRILTQDLEIMFEEYHIEDIDTISRDVAMLVSNVPSGSTSATRVGILASSKFQQLVSPLIADDLSKYARLLIEISLALRGGDGVTQYAGYSIDELRHLQSFAGTRVIQGLETALKIPFDKESSVHRGQALFLTLFIVIVAVASYCPQLNRPQSSLLDPAAGAHTAAQNQLLRILSHHMVYTADRLNLLHTDTARDRIARDPANELGRLVRVRWVEDRALETMPLDAPHQPLGVGACKNSKEPRQVLITSDDDTLLPLEHCESCKKMKRRATLRKGKCSECQLKKFWADPPRHFLAIKRIMDLQDRASYLIDDDRNLIYMAQSDSDSDDIELDSSGPHNPLGDTLPDNSTNGRAQATRAMADAFTVPLWEQCAFCESRSGFDGECDECRNSNNPSYLVEHTNFPREKWLDLLAIAGPRQD